MIGFHQCTLITTAAAIRPYSSRAAAVNLTLSILDRSRISSLDRRRGMSRTQASPSLAERATTVSVIRYSPELNLTGGKYPVAAPLPIRVYPELRTNFNSWLRGPAATMQPAIPGGAIVAFPPDPR